MTSLVAWIGIDSRGPTSAYLASDSRISWQSNSSQAWDMGPKLFSARNHEHPEILGYCGDVTFPSLVLKQAVDRINRNVIFSRDDPPHAKQDKISKFIKASFEGYPPERRGAFTVLYCTRQHSGMSASFHFWSLNWAPESGWRAQIHEIPKESGLVVALGSGGSSVREWSSRWANSDVGRTSRSIFSAFCDSLQSQKDRLSGGPPQLVGVYRKGPAETFGIIYNNMRYFDGTPAHEDQDWSGIEWRNSLFERCDWKTLLPMEGAQRHARPRGLPSASGK
jgi:hypothetical protein